MEPIKVSKDPVSSHIISTEYMIDNNLVKSKSHHTIVRIISKIKNTNKDYFGWTFK